VSRTGDVDRLFETYYGDPGMDVAGLVEKAYDLGRAQGLVDAADLLRAGTKREWSLSAIPIDLRAEARRRRKKVLCV
jgi:hypothetical protein